MCHIHFLGLLGVKECFAYTKKKKKTESKSNKTVTNLEMVRKYSNINSLLIDFLTLERFFSKTRNDHVAFFQGLPFHYGCPAIVEDTPGLTCLQFELRPTGLVF